MSKWLLILALNYSDGGSAVQYHEFQTKEACVAAIAISIQAAQAVAVNPFAWTGKCLDLENPPKDLKAPGTPMPENKQQNAPKMDSKTRRSVVY